MRYAPLTDAEALNEEMLDYDWMWIMEDRGYEPFADEDGWLTWLQVARR